MSKSKKSRSTKAKTVAPGAYLAPLIDHTVWDNTPHRVTLFTIVKDGEATPYSMPARQHPGLALAYLKRARHDGEQLAASWLLEEVFGEEGYDALAAEPDVTLELINNIARHAVKIITGKVKPVPDAVDETESDGEVDGPLE